MPDDVKTVCLITTGQPSTNPRLVKEAHLLAESGYRVWVLYCYWHAWACGYDAEMIQRAKWQARLVGGSPQKNYWLYFFTRIRQKLAFVLVKRGLLKHGIVEYYQGRAYRELLNTAKSIKADLYIAHTLGALPVAVKAAKANRANCGFDAEDFHRHENSDDTNHHTYIVAKFLEDKYLPQVNYLSAASPLIADVYKKLYPMLHPLVVHNVFVPVLNYKKANENGQSIKLFWFSQTIGANRGLEEVAEAIAMAKKPNVSLHLLGNVSPAYKIQLQLLWHKYGLTNDRLCFYDPIAPDDVAVFAAQFDVGLALEQPTPMNRDICLTNKIFTYLAAGLAIIATQTQAQKLFLEQNPKVGQSYPLREVATLANLISKLETDKNYLHQTKSASLQAANESWNWHIEGEKWLSAIRGWVMV